jgi:hypothetical protein
VSISVDRGDRVNERREQVLACRVLCSDWERIEEMGEVPNAWTAVCLVLVCGVHGQGLSKIFLMQSMDSIVNGDAIVSATHEHVIAQAGGEELMISDL